MKPLNILAVVLALTMGTLVVSPPFETPLDPEPAAAISNCPYVDQYTAPYFFNWTGHYVSWAPTTSVAAGPCLDLNVKNRGYQWTQIGSMYKTRNGAYRLASAAFGWVRPGGIRVTITNIRAGTKTVTGTSTRSWPIRVAS